jgi:hypothetical protein
MKCTIDNFISQQFLKLTLEFERVVCFDNLFPFVGFDVYILVHEIHFRFLDHFDGLKFTV